MATMAILILVLLAQLATAQPTPSISGKIWRVTQAPSESASGSIYIFLPNGTLLETSCVETYRIAKWSANPKDPKSLTVVEDGQPAFTARIVELTRTTLRLQKKLVRSSEPQDVRFAAIEKEFVCSDLPK